MDKSLAEHLRDLEYAVRQSMTVREDQDEPADPAHIEAAKSHGIATGPDATKGDLLSAVQTRIRASQ